jgi:hypothetical protein
MNYLATSLAAVLFLGAASITALAQTSMSDSLGDDQQTITGDVTTAFDNRFVLDNGTSRILVDAGPDWYQQTDIREDDRVTVRGEAKRNHFDAYTITAADGQTIEIRSAEGAPSGAMMTSGRASAPAHCRKTMTGASIASGLNGVVTMTGGTVDGPSVTAMTAAATTAEGLTATCQLRNVSRSN